jgi:hypothetical protein
MEMGSGSAYRLPTVLFGQKVKRDLQHEKRNHERMSKRLFASLDPSISASPYGEVG